MTDLAPVKYKICTDKGMQTENHLQETNHMTRERSESAVILSSGPAGIKILRKYESISSTDIDIV